MSCIATVTPSAAFLKMVQVDVKIGVCNPFSKKPHVVHLIEYITIYQNYYLCFTITYYGGGVADFGVDHHHIDEGATLSSKIPLTREQLEHLLHGMEV